MHPFKYGIAYRLVYAGSALIALILIMSRAPDLLPPILDNFSKVVLLKGIEASSSYEYLVFQDETRYLPQNGRPFFERSLKLADLAEMYRGRDSTSDTAGLALLHLGEYDQAVEYLERGSTLAPKNPFIKFWLGVAYENAGYPDKAYALWGESGLFGHIVDRANVLFEQKRYSDVEDLVLKVLRTCSSGSCREIELGNLWETLGRAYRDQQRYSEAVVAYSAALDYLQLPQYLEGLALSYMGNSDYERAIDILLQLADESPKNAAYQIWLGQSYADLGLYVEAEERFHRGLLLSKGKDEWGYHELARFYEDQKRYDDADRIMSMLIGDIPQRVCSQLVIWYQSLANTNRRSEIFEDTLLNYQDSCLDLYMP